LKAEGETFQIVIRHRVSDHAEFPHD